MIAFTELPLWLRKVSEGMLDVDIDGALAAGLTFRPLAETIRETFEWHENLPPDAGDRESQLYRVEGKAGLTPEREAALLAECHAREARQ